MRLVPVLLDTTANNSDLILALVFFIAAITMFTVYGVSKMRIFAKAGQFGSIAFVPYSSTRLLLRICGLSESFAWLLRIPLLGGIVLRMLCGVPLARAFGKGVGFGLGLSFLGLVFYPILAFDDSKYIGPPLRDKSFPPHYA